jgi:outer membrane receptor protein involved in Fe transport
MQRPDRKYSAGSFVNYEFNEHVDVYGEVMFMDDYSRAQIAPSANFGSTDQVNCDNPMLSDQQRELLCGQFGLGPDDYANVIIGRRSVETGPRTSVLRHTNWRLLAGVRGDINDQWSYDLYGMYAEVAFPEEYIGDLNVASMINAIDVIGDPDDPSTWQCRVGGNCAPWNIFQENSVSQEGADYIRVNLISTSGLKTQLVNGSINGDLEDYGIKFPGASEGIQIALGTEFRAESMFVHPDSNWEAGNASGLGGPRVRIDGRYSVYELFMESLIPVIQDSPGFKDLSFELGYRYSDYSTSGGQSTWKVQGTWAPADLIKFRAGFARAIRAPNIRDLYAPQGLGLGGSEDPCANDVDTGVPSLSLEECMRTGMTAAQYGTVISNPADQYNTFGGGSLLLDPESADTITFGMVITPPSIPGFSLALDYYDIEITDTIGYIDADTVITACAASGDPYLCGLINRDFTGSLWLTPGGFTRTTNDNIGTLYGEGVDVNFSYLAQLGDLGFLNTTLTGTYMLANRYADPIVDYDCVGYYGNQCAPYPTPEWRHLARFSWETNFDWVFSLGWRYITAVTIDDASPEPDLRNEGALPTHRTNGTYKNPSFNYFDLAFSWNIDDHVQLVFGCNNLMDKEPPLAANMNDNDYGPGFYGFYDPYGRHLHAALHFDF